MKPTLIDTDILSMYFRGNEIVRANFENYIETHGKVNISIITYLIEERQNASKIGWQ